MQSYWKTIEKPDKIERGMFIIFPLRYDEEVEISEISVEGKEPVKFESTDFTELMIKKCSLDGKFVRRFELDAEISPIRWQEDAGQEREIAVSDVQLFIFDKGIAFITVYLKYDNGTVDSVYQFIYPGYMDETSEIKQAQNRFVREIREKLLSKIRPKTEWFIADEQIQSYILKEAYRLNVAYVPKRFQEMDVVNRMTYNAHRIVDLTLDFTDTSEKDVAYVTGARDVESKDYGWGCCVTSQEISYVYAKKGELPLPQRASDDLLLTLLVMYQKYTCILLNEEIHERYAPDKNRRRKSVQKLKHEAMEFIAYGTLAPSQISRWNNVCDTYQNLIKLNGVDEIIEEIEQKIDLLNAEQERIDSRRENSIGMIITVFGLISIISSVMQIVDYLFTGRREIWISFVLSVFSVLLLAVCLGGMLLKRKNGKEDV